MGKYEKRIYNQLIEDIELLIDNTDDEYLKKKLEEIANGIDEIYEGMDYELELIREDLDVLEDRLSYYKNTYY